MYFSVYPKVAYKVDEFDYIKAIDITSSIKIKKYISSYKGITYTPYIVKNGERPDAVSYKLYGKEKYDWILLLVNDIDNIYEDWSKSDSDMIDYITEKYGSMTYATSAIKHYYDTYGNIIDQTTYFALPQGEKRVETYYEYEVRKNYEKAQIKTISPSLINTIEYDFRKIMLSEE